MRYIVSDDVEHGCCHEASVVDTYIEDVFERHVCECGSKAMAQEIADALNREWSGSCYT